MLDIAVAPIIILLKNQVFLDSLESKFKYKAIIIMNINPWMFADMFDLNTSTYNAYKAEII